MSELYQPRPFWHFEIGKPDSEGYLDRASDGYLHSIYYDYNEARAEAIKVTTGGLHPNCIVHLTLSNVPGKREIIVVEKGLTRPLRNAPADVHE